MKMVIIGAKQKTAVQYGGGLSINRQPVNREKAINVIIVESKHFIQQVLLVLLMYGGVPFVELPN